MLDTVEAGNVVVTTETDDLVERGKDFTFSLWHAFICSLRQPVLWRYFPQFEQQAGLALLSNCELHLKHSFPALDALLGRTDCEVEAWRIASFVFFIEKFLALACSLNLTITKFFRNHNADLEESGIMELP